jgi:hypothetical protein
LTTDHWPDRFYAGYDAHERGEDRPADPDGARGWDARAEAYPDEEVLRRHKMTKAHFVHASEKQPSRRSKREQACIVDMTALWARRAH